MTKRPTSQLSLEPRPLMRTDIYKNAVNNFRKIYPQYDAMEMVASRLGKTSKWAYAVLEGRIILDVLTEERLFSICNYPQGFQEKVEFVFPINEVKK